MTKPIRIVLSILGFILSLIVIGLILCLVAYLMNRFGAGDNAFVDAMYQVMRFLHFVE